MQNQNKERRKMIYDNIKNCAKKRGLSLMEVERRAGLARGHIEKWKKIFNPSLTSLQKVADALGVSVSTLLKEEKD